MARSPAWQSSALVAVIFCWRRPATRAKENSTCQAGITNVNGDGVVHDLARVLASFYQSLPRDLRLLTTPEKEELYRQIVAALSTEGALTDYGKNLARRLAGLDSLDGQVDSAPWEREGQPGSRNPSKENGGYRIPPEPANRPSSVAKSADMDEFMRNTRAQIRVIASRIEALIQKQGR